MDSTNTDARRRILERAPHFLVQRFVDCREEVDRLAALESVPLDSDALAAEFEIYLRQSETQSASSLSVSLQLWVAFAALVTAWRDLN